MNRSSYYVQVFEPLYTYERMQGWVEDQSALRHMLKYIGTPVRLGDDGGEERYPLQTSYYQYAPYVAVLLERRNTFYCQTYVNGVPERLYNMQSETEELRRFFAQAEGNITVLDNTHGRQFAPQLEQVERYVAAVRKARADLEAQREVINEYACHLQELTDAGEDLLNQDPINVYDMIVELANRFMQAMRYATEDIHRQTRREIDSCCIPLDEESAVVYTFGLYLYALRYGLGQGRFLHKRLSSAASLFGEMLRDMHAFLQEYEGVVEQYCEVMQLPENEREALLALLEREGLSAPHWHYIGDDLF